MSRPPKGAFPAQFGRAIDSFRAGQLIQAERLCRAMVPAWPREAAVRRLLGMVCQARGDMDEARGQFAAATRFAPADPDGWSDYGQCLLQNGEVARAVDVLRRAVRLAPRHALAQHNLGLALASCGDSVDAEAAFRRATAEEPTLGGAWHHLAQLVHEHDPAAAARFMATAVRLMPGYALARMHHAAMLEEAGRPAEAAQARAAALARDPALAATAESHAYLRAAAGAAPRFGCRFALLRHALSLAPATGACLEFGVRWGTSAAFLARHVERLHGFDSLEGLPEAWVAGEGRGSYSTAGAPPELPQNVTLHPGWFRDTLPAFRDACPGPVRFVHVDCDLYGSAREVLTDLADRLQPGTVLVFDEYHSYPGWREHEFRAFQEFIAEHRRSYAYVGWTLFGRQAAVRLD